MEDRIDQLKMDPFSKQNYLVYHEPTQILVAGTVSMVDMVMDDDLSSRGRVLPLQRPISGSEPPWVSPRGLARLRRHYGYNAGPLGHLD